MVQKLRLPTLTIEAVTAPGTLKNEVGLFPTTAPALALPPLGDYVRLNVMLTPHSLPSLPSQCHALAVDADYVYVSGWREGLIQILSQGVEWRAFFRFLRPAT